MSINVAPIESIVPGQAGKILTILALNDDGSFTDEHDPLLEKITFSTTQPDPSCVIPDSRTKSRALSLRRLNWKNVVVAVCLWVAYTLCNVAFSIIAPFFPQIAESKGASPIVIGVILGSAPFCVVVLSPVFGYLLPHIGVWLQIFMGLFLVGTSYVSLAFMIMIHSDSAFIVSCIFLRIVEGVGTGMLTTAIFSTFPNLFPNSVGTLMGLFELGCGFGYSLGPTLGGVMYQYGGYKVPFLSVGISILFFVIPCTLLVRKMRVDYEKKTLPSKVICKLSTNLLFISLVIVMATVYNPLAFFTPTLPMYLDQEFNQNTLMVGILYFIGAFTYLVAALPVGPLTDRVGHNRYFTVSGLLVVCFGYIIFGIPYYLGYMNIWLIRIGSGILCIGDAMAVVPLYADLLSIGKRYLGPDDNMAALSSFMSGLIAASGNLNMLLGPIVGGIATTFISIPASVLILAQVVLAEAIAIIGLSIIDKKTMHA